MLKKTAYDRNLQLRCSRTVCSEGSTQPVWITNSVGEQSLQVRDPTEAAEQEQYKDSDHRCNPFEKPPSPRSKAEQILEMEEFQEVPALKHAQTQVF